MTGNRAKVWHKMACDMLFCENSVKDEFLELYTVKKKEGKKYFNRRFKFCSFTCAIEFLQRMRPESED